MFSVTLFEALIGDEIKYNVNLLHVSTGLTMTVDRVLSEQEVLNNLPGIGCHPIDVFDELIRVKGLDAGIELNNQAKKNYLKVWGSE